MKRIILLITTAVLLLTTCRKDNRDRLFEMYFPNITFQIPAGTGGIFPWAVELPAVATNIDFYLAENDVDTALIRSIEPISAYLTSLDGFDLDFLEWISVRVCEVEENACINFYEVFYIDDIYRRATENVDLLPGLRNARRELVNKQVRIEILFKFAEPAPYSIDGRMDMTFAAFD